MKVILTILLLATASFAAEFYASPSGSGSTCSLASPCSLQTALNNQANMGVGDTLYLRGGTYTGQWNSNLDGGTVKSYCAKTGPCKPDNAEWAKLDGYYTATITNTIDADDTAITVSGSFVLQLGSVLRIESEDVYLSAGTFPNYTIVRGWGGTLAVGHAADTPFYLFGNQLVVNGSNTIYRDFEITDSNPTRAYAIGGYGGYFRGGSGIFNFCLDCKFINLSIHDNLNGFFESETAKRTEVYGCLMFNNGHVSIDRPHGHNFYLQNVSGGTKYIRDVISLNAFALGLKVYGASEGHANDFEIDGYVGYNNGSPGYYSGTPTTNGGGSPNRRYGNLEVGSDTYPSLDIVINNVYLFHASGKTVEIPGLSVGRAPSGGNQDVSITDSIVVESSDIVTVDKWTNITNTGNIFYNNTSGALQFLGRAIDPAGTVVWNNNTYYDTTGLKNCVGGSFQAPFNRNTFTGACGTSLRFTDWQSQTGYDANSTYNTSAPTGQTIIVRQNAYEAGRNHIIVYNFDGSASFQFTPQGLANGQAYTLYDTQNWPTEYHSGTYSGGSITVSLSGSAEVQEPTGHTFTPATTQPGFAAFLLIPGDGSATKMKMRGVKVKGVRI